MKRMILALIVLTLGMLFATSCNEPSPIGAELVDGDQANIKHTDTLTFTTITVNEDSVLVYDPNPSIVYNNFFIGDFDDPVFGNTKAEFGGQLWPNGTPNFEGAIWDSTILTLLYDSTNTYGDLVTDPFNLEVYQLNQSLDPDEKHYSNYTFEYNMTPVGGTGNFIPQVGDTDTVRVLDYTFPPSIDTLTLAAQLRIPLSETFGNDLLDSMLYTSTATFLEHLNGLVVKANASNTTKGILSFNLLSLISNMTLYYHTIESEDTVYRQFRYIYPPSGVYFSNFDHTFSPLVESGINDKSTGDSLIFIQSMSGPNIKIEVPYVDKLGDIIVNKAELVFTAAELDDDDLDIYLPLDRSIVAITDDVNDGFLFINDVIVGGTWFGGTVDETVDNDGEKLYTYTFNISSHFQRMVEGSADNTIFIRAFPKQESAKRAVLYGPQNSKYPVKLKLTYTKLNP